MRYVEGRRHVRAFAGRQRCGEGEAEDRIWPRCKSLPRTSVARIRPAWWAVKASRHISARNRSFGCVAAIGVAGVIGASTGP